MPQSKEVHREYMRQRRKGEAPKPLGEAPKTEYPAIIKALADSVKREKLRKICVSLARHNVLNEVYYGVGKDPTLMSEVAELLEAF